MAEINSDGIIVSENSLYVPQTWIDGVDEYTPLNAERLNHMELGIAKVAESCDSISQIVEKAQAAVENALAPVALSANINTTSCTCAFNAKRLGRLVIVSGTIMPKTTGAGLRLLEVIGGRATTMAYGAAVQYNGPSGKVYAVAGSSGTTYLNFDIPTHSVNYNFSISYWV